MQRKQAKNAGPRNDSLPLRAPVSSEQNGPVPTTQDAGGAGEHPAAVGVFGLVVFTLDERTFALPLEDAERVYRAVEVTPLPKAHEIVLGIVNAQGRVIPVIDTRGRFRLPARRLRLTDHLLVVRTSRRIVALLVDAVGDVIQRSEDDIVARGAIVPGMEYVKGVVRLDDGLILIHDLEECLSLEEHEALDAAMTEADGRP